MVDFDAAVAAVQDPNADPVFLAKIAYENPEFGANVVANPKAYPGLKRWVAEFGDERARQQLMAMGWPVSQTGIRQRPAAEPAPEQPATQYSEPYTAAQPEADQPEAAFASVSQTDEPKNGYSAFTATAINADAAAQADAATSQADEYSAQAQSWQEADSFQSQPSDDTQGLQEADQQITAAQETPEAQNADAAQPNGYTAQLAMTTTDQMLMAHIAGEAPELRPALARNPNIYPELLQWLAQFNDSAINAAIRSRQ